MSYGRMKEKQQQLKEELKQLLEQAEAADQDEDRQYGSKRGDELPEELQRRETRLAKIKEAKQVVEQRPRGPGNRGGQERRTLGMAEDTWALNEQAIDEKAFLDQVYLTYAEREAM